MCVQNAKAYNVWPVKYFLIAEPKTEQLLLVHDFSLFHSISIQTKPLKF